MYEKWVDGVPQADFVLESDVRVEFITFRTKFLVSQYDDL
jgi:hypothetical protein